MSPFSSIIGHKTAMEVLGRLLEHDKLPHALLFVGPSSIGKTFVAERLIQALFGADRPIASLTDVVTLKRERDPKTQKRKSAISVKQVRTVIDRLSMTSLEGGWKVAFIREADKLSPGAANALLKTLEEPKGKTLLILRASSTESVLPTILSRCQTIRLAPVAKQVIALALEKRGLGKEEAAFIAARSLGRPGLALRYVSDSALRARKETAIHQIQTLFTAPLAEQFRMVTELIPKTELDKAHVLSDLLEDWSEVLRDEMIDRMNSAAGVSVQKSTRVLKAIQQVQSGLRHNINPHLALEHIFLATH